MGTYRVEISKNARAGCKNTACKAKNIKIQKDELRFGSLVEVKEHQSWSWKHWGCVTPTQIQNLKISIQDNLDDLDGYDELSPEMQLKIRNAVEQGHVADEDWTGDAELNRPGEKGVHKRASKKSNGEAQEGEDGAENNAKSATKKRSRDKGGEDEEKPAAVKKSKTGPKKAKPTATAADDAANDDNEEEQAPTKAKAAGRKAKKTTNVPTSDMHANGKELSDPKKTRPDSKHKPTRTEPESDAGEKPAAKARASKKKADKGGEDKSAVSEPNKANGTTSPIRKGRKAAPKSSERVKDSDDEDGGVPVESGTVTVEPEAEAKTSGKGKEKAKGGGAAKNSTSKEKK
ncbi:hypothetical protein GP486_004788 [Trichoglossum hirsutum]|uniref:PARP-type domain-containing protein n=1 Tax=Trichoglossum hirsutum TaxID=265104 RepID=A0A9P8LAE2_9PEZI|nr:hypothetical protein GP486_004788 [Trichoglossum hirsutum]